MNFTTQRLPESATGKSPAHVFNQVRTEGIWCVPHSPVHGVSQIDWRHNVRNEKIIIPTFRYITEQDPAMLCAYMIQLGMLALRDCPVNNVSRIHVVYGNTVDSLQDPNTNKTMYSINIGFGFLSKV